MSSEDFIRFILILFSILGPIRLLGNVTVNLQSGIASAERVFGILETKPQIVERKNPIKIEKIDSKIEFKDVSFSYHEGLKYYQMSLSQLKG